MARLRIRIPVIDSDGTRQPGATVKLYAAGTASTVGSPASSTTGTPFAGALYAANSGGSALGTTAFTADANGDVVVFTETAARADIGVEISGVGARVFPLEEFFYDPADLSTLAALATTLADYATLTGAETLENKSLTAPVVTGQATFADGSLAAPSVRVGDEQNGLYSPGAGVIGLGANGAIGFVLDGNSTPAGPRSYIVDPLNTKAVLTVTRGTSASVGTWPDTTYTMAFAATSFADAGDGLGGNPTALSSQGIKGSAYVVDGTGGFHAGTFGLAEATSTGSWDPSGGGLIGAFGQANSYKTSGRSWGSNFIAKGLLGDQSTLLASEMGVEAQTPVENRYGVQIITLADGLHYGSTEDIGLKFADKSNPTVADNQFRTLIGFGSPGTAGATLGWPLVSTGTLIKAYGKADGTTVQAAVGIDLNSVTFSSASLLMPGFRVGPAGRVQVKSTANVVDAPLYINANGENSNLRIDNAITNGSAGAGAATHLKVLLGGVMHTLTLNAI